MNDFEQYCEKYAEFLKSQFWAEVSSRCKELAGWKCEKCGRDIGLNAHHKVYRNDWYETKIEDLICLCYQCHGKEHGRKMPSVLPQPIPKGKMNFKQWKRKKKEEKRKCLYLCKKYGYYDLIPILDKHYG